MLKEMQGAMNEIKVCVPKSLQFLNSPEMTRILNVHVLEKRKKIYLQIVFLKSYHN